MTDVSNEDIRSYRAEAETTEDQPLSAGVKRPGGQRAKVLSIRLNPEEFDELARFAGTLDVPASTLARSWILDQLQNGSDSPQRAVERLARDLEQLRRQIVA